MHHLLACLIHYIMLVCARSCLCAAILPSLTDHQLVHLPWEEFAIPHVVCDYVWCSGPMLYAIFHHSTSHTVHMYALILVET